LGRPPPSHKGFVAVSLDQDWILPDIAMGRKVLDWQNIHIVVQRIRGGGDVACQGFQAVAGYGSDLVMAASQAQSQLPGTHKDGHPSINGMVHGVIKASNPIHGSRIIYLP
jgi:hypothetical protein